MMWHYSSQVQLYTCYENFEFLKLDLHFVSWENANEQGPKIRCNHKRPKILSSQNSGNLDIAHKIIINTWH